jgi:flavin-dependent thymidylate synthase
MESKMKVDLITCTGAGLGPWHAARLLVFTKNTRLNMDSTRWENIFVMDNDSLLAELEYMANTIPSSWEFVDYIFSIQGVTRAYTHQQVRTRAGSYAQQSMRVTDMSGFGYRVPPNLEPDPDAPSIRQEQYNVYAQTMDYIKQGYQSMIAMGVAEEDARGVLPTNILTNIVCKFNLRTLSEIVRSREGGRTQDEYREVVKLMGDAVLRVHPWASLFLYPKGRDHWKDLEEGITAKISNMASRNELLKIVDKMRKDG